MTVTSKGVPLPLLMGRKIKRINTFIAPAGKATAKRSSKRGR